MKSLNIDTKFKFMFGILFLSQVACHINQQNSSDDYGIAFSVIYFDPKPQEKTVIQFYCENRDDVYVESSVPKGWNNVQNLLYLQCGMKIIKFDLIKKKQEVILDLDNTELNPKSKEWGWGRSAFNWCISNNGEIFAFRYQDNSEIRIISLKDYKIIKIVTENDLKKLTNLQLKGALPLLDNMALSNDGSRLAFSIRSDDVIEKDVSGRSFSNTYILDIQSVNSVKVGQGIPISFLQNNKILCVQDQLSGQYVDIRIYTLEGKLIATKSNVVWANYDGENIVVIEKRKQEGVIKLYDDSLQRLKSEHKLSKEFDINSWNRFIAFRITNSGK